jgi:hypothetical protein
MAVVTTARHGADGGAFDAIPQASMIDMIRDEDATGVAERSSSQGEGSFSGTS